jgi:outer membrane biosynthesis protein TonB
MVALLVGTIALPIVEREKLNELPERIAKLVRQKQIPPPPPVPVEEPTIPEEELPEPDPQLAEEQPPDELPEQPKLADAEQPDTREQVKSKGILAFRDSFANRANIRPMAQLGSQANMNSAGEDAIGRPERLMVTSSAPGSSGGINLSNISRNVGGGGEGMEGVALSRVASSIGGGDGPDRPFAGGAMAGRTDEEIQIVFDRYKAALYRLYNRELRKDPTLRGQLVLQLTIEPDGSVSLCRLHSSDMKAATLAQQVVQRVLTFDFGAKEDIVAMTIIYPIDFLPAA